MSRSAVQPHCRIGIDVGGTFTDFVLADRLAGTLTHFKEPSTPADPSLSVERGLPALLKRAGVGPEAVELVVHGTTLMVNAIIQHRGAKVGLVVSKGHRGVLEIGRTRLPNAYNFQVRKEQPLVPLDLIFEVGARLRADGHVLSRPTDDELRSVAEQLRHKGVEAVTVLLLHSYAYPALEGEVAARLRALLPDLPVTESAQIWPERREFERSQVAIINAYLQPLMNSYLDRLMERVTGLGIAAPVYITASNGGTLSLETARARPEETILSGPAAGVVAASRVAAQAKRQNLITIDIGGTSCDVGLSKSGEPEYSTRAHVGDYPIMLPVVNVSAIGAGGGSIVWVDPQGVLKVGPRSAGGDPGPVCYGRGGRELTVTDCYLIAGIIHPDHFLGGRMKLDREAAEQAVIEIGKKIGIEGERAAERTADAVLRVTTAVMSTALFRYLSQRGEDPREFSLMAFGGAGPTHANLLADEAAIRTIIVPAQPATFCALGAVLTDVMRDYIRSRVIDLSAGMAAAAELKALFREIEDEARRWIGNEGAILGEIAFSAAADVRYVGEAFELRIAIPDDLRRQPDAQRISELFHREHERVYGFRDPASGVELVTERLRVTGRMPATRLPEVPGRPAPAPEAARRVFHDSAFHDVPVFRRADLGRDATFVGPAIVEQEDTTVWILPRWRATVDANGNLLLNPAA